MKIEIGKRFIQNICTINESLARMGSASLSEALMGERPKDAPEDKSGEKMMVDTIIIKGIYILITPYEEPVVKVAYSIASDYNFRGNEDYYEELSKFRTRLKNWKELPND